MLSTKNILWPAVLLMATTTVGFAQNKTYDRYGHCHDKYEHKCDRDRDKYGCDHDHDRDGCDRDHDRYGRDKYDHDRDGKEYPENSQGSTESSNDS